MLAYFRYFLSYLWLYLTKVKEVKSVFPNNIFIKNIKNVFLMIFLLKILLFKITILV